MKYRSIRQNHLSGLRLSYTSLIMLERTIVLDILDYLVVWNVYNKTNYGYEI